MVEQDAQWLSCQNINFAILPKNANYSTNSQNAHREQKSRTRNVWRALHRVSRWGIMVHVNHGVGKIQGMETRNWRYPPFMSIHSSRWREFYSFQFLTKPVQNIPSGCQRQKLTPGSTEWRRRNAKTHQKMIADELIELAPTRCRVRYAFSRDT